MGCRRADLLKAHSSAEQLRTGAEQLRASAEQCQEGAELCCSSCNRLFGDPLLVARANHYQHTECPTPKYGR